MARFLRVVRQARWSRPTWAPNLPLKWQGAALGDLQTTNNVLSVYLVDTQEMTDQVVAALAANRDNISHLDYATINVGFLSALNLQAVQEDGRTSHAGQISSTST